MAPASLLAGWAHIYLSGLSLQIPLLSLPNLISFALFITAGLLFLVTAPAAIASIALRKRKPAWLLSVVIPPLAVVLLFSAPRPEWLDGAERAITKNASEEALLAFAREARNAARTDGTPASLGGSPISRIPDRLLEKLPTNLRTSHWLEAETPRYRVYSDHIDILYGAPRVGWGLLIVDAAKDGDLFERNYPFDHRFVLYKKLYERVWIYSTFSTSA